MLPPFVGVLGIRVIVLSNEVDHAHGEKRQSKKATQKYPRGRHLQEGG